MPTIKLNKNTKDEFEKVWYETMPNRVREWLAGLPVPLKNELDSTPESIQALQKYLWEHFDSSNIANEDNKAELECIAYYYGEIHRKYMPIEMAWVSSDILNKGGVSSMYLKNHEYLNAGTVIFSKIIASVSENKRGVNYLLTYYKKRLSTLQSKFDNKEFSSVFVIRLDDNYQFFLLHKTDTNALPQIKILLEDYFSTRDNPPKLSYYRDSEDYLIVEMSDEYCFHFKFKSGDWTKESIERMANEKYTGGLDKKAIAQCQSTIEFWGDQDHNMDYINESLWLLEYLSSKLPDLVSIVDLKNDGEIFP